MKPISLKNEILIAEYDPCWPRIYCREKKKIFAAIGDKIKFIEHIGSTAVPGLAAKPVIDIMAAIESFDLTKELIEPLAHIGYQYTPEYERNIPDRRFFHCGPAETTAAANRHFHLHIVEIGSNFWTTHILFRDYLRKSQNISEEYGNLKKKLAVTCNGDINKYCDGKNTFIKKIIQLAFHS